MKSVLSESNSAFEPSSGKINSKVETVKTCGLSSCANIMDEKKNVNSNIVATGKER
jgi:hypothetical protein